MDHTLEDWTPPPTNVKEVGRQAHPYIYIYQVFSPFSDGVGLALHNISSPGVLVKSIGAEFFYDRMHFLA